MTRSDLRLFVAAVAALGAFILVCGHPSGAWFEFRTAFSVGDTHEGVCDAEVDHWRQLVDERDATIDDLRRRLGEHEVDSHEDSQPHGDPVALEFATAVGEALGRCNIKVDRADIDCSEAPCMVILDNPQPGETSWLPNCEPWARRYGSRVSLSNRPVACADGIERQVQIISPWTARDEHLPDREQRFERLEQRWANHERAVCAARDAQ